MHTVSSNAKISFAGEELYNGNDTVFVFDVETGELKAGDYEVNMYAVDDDENEANLKLLLRVNPIKPVVGRLSVSDVRATEAKIVFDIKSFGGVDMVERGVSYTLDGNEGVDIIMLIPALSAGTESRNNNEQDWNYFSVHNS